MSFRVRLALLISALLFAVFASLIIFMWLQQSAMLRSQMAQQGEILGKGLCAAALRSLMAYDYVDLNILANEASVRLPGSYVVIHDKEGRIAGHSRCPELLRLQPNDEAGARAAQIWDILISESDQHLEIAVPAMADAFSRWGVVRVGLPLEPMRRQLRRLAMTIGIAGALALAAGVALSSRLARHVSRPLSLMVESTVRAARGELDQEIAIGSGDEFDALAKNFTFMMRELKAREAQVRQSERLATLGTVAASLAHEIRNPLTALKTFAGGVPQHLGKPGFLEKYQARVPGCISRIEGIVNGLLDVARKPTLVLTPVSLGDLARRALEMNEEELARRDVVVETNIAREIPDVLLDQELVLQALHNLVLNAAQSMAQGGWLAVEVGIEEGAAWVRVEDRGTGIPEGQLARIFDPFFTTKPRGQGTGLGLAIVQKIVAEHGGRVEVESAVGQGTAFTLRFPCSASS